MGQLILQGYNALIGTTFRDFWNRTAQSRTKYATAVTCKVTSTGAGDTSAGACAKTVRVWGVDATYAEIYEDFILAGTTAAVGTKSFLRINRMEVLTVGAIGWNTGTIYVFNAAGTSTSGTPTTATNVFGLIVPKDNVSAMGMYTVPLGKWVKLKQVMATSYDATTTVKYGVVQMTVKEGSAAMLTYYLGGTSGASGQLNWNPARPVYFPEKTEIIFQGKISASGPMNIMIEFETSDETVTM
jgi:hypothetical protein